MNPIYLDYHATTPVDERVLAAMLPYFSERFGNPASAFHSYGWDAENAVDRGRQQVARAIGAEPSEIIFTSGATEAVNLAIKGVAEAYAATGNHIITAVTEHKAVIDSCRYLQRRGFDVTYLPVDGVGMVDPDMLREACTARTILVSIMHANNEIGTVQNLTHIGECCRERGILFHTDATQALGRIPFDVDQMLVDLASFSSHKMYGPKGCGALYLRKDRPRVRLIPQIHGGGQEQDLRSGTLNVSGIVGFGMACELVFMELPEEMRRVERLRDVMRDRLFSCLEDLHLNGHPVARLPGNLHISFGNIPADTLLGSLKGLAVSSGAACSSDTLDVSHVLKAIGLTLERARSSLRFGIGRFTTDEEIDRATEMIIRSVRRLRAERREMPGTDTERHRGFIQHQ